MADKRCNDKDAAIAGALDHKRPAEQRERLRRMDPADVADLLEDAPPDSRDRIFEMLDVDQASDVFVELQPDVADDLAEGLSPEEFADLVDQMAPDDAADVLADLEEDQRVRVLAAMEDGDAVAELLPYSEDSAGHVMTTEVCAMTGETTVAQAREEFSDSEGADPYFYIFVVDNLQERRLLGLLPATALLSAEPESTLEQLAESDFVACGIDDDQEEVAQTFRKYDLWVLPVLTPDGRLAGRITVDDVMDVMHEEADEDLAYMVGAPDIDEEEDSPFRIVRLRLPWLVITVFAGIGNSIIVTKMLAAVDNIVAIAVFVPVILAMGGNTGMQSSAIAVRGIALDARRYRRLLRLVGREMLVGACLGGCCGILAGGLVFSVIVLTGADTGGLNPVRIAGSVSLAMALAMMFASSFGSIFPILLHRLHVDPAVASGPFVTTSNDLSSAAIYFLVCYLLL